jgi:hypothetical protein
MAESDIAAIQWPAPTLANLEMWEYNLDIVRWLCTVGEVRVWMKQDDPRDPYQHFPYIYGVDGVEVEFLPHWGFYSVGQLNFELPASKDVILVHVQYLQQLDECLAQMKKSGLRSIGNNWTSRVGLHIAEG